MGPSPTLPSLICNHCMRFELNALQQCQGSQGRCKACRCDYSQVFMVGLNNEVGLVIVSRMCSQEGVWVTGKFIFPTEGAFHFKPIYLVWLHVSGSLCACSASVSCLLPAPVSECLAATAGFTASSWGQAGLGEVPAGTQAL